MAIRLTEGPDVREFDVFNEMILALGGDDVVTVRGDDNTLDGGAGDDRLDVTGSGNTVLGGTGDDVLTASASAFG